MIFLTYVVQTFFLVLIPISAATALYKLTRGH